MLSIHFASALFWNDLITTGIAGKMAAIGQGVQGGMLIWIGLNRLVTLPVTIMLEGALFYLLGR